MNLVPALITNLGTGASAQSQPTWWALCCLRKGLSLLFVPQGCSSPHCCPELLVPLLPWLSYGFPLRYHIVGKDGKSSHLFQVGSIVFRVKTQNQTKQTKMTGKSTAKTRRRQGFGLAARVMTAKGSGWVQQKGWRYSWAAQEWAQRWQDSWSSEEKDLRCGRVGLGEQVPEPSLLPCLESGHWSSSPCHGWVFPTEASGTESPRGACLGNSPQGSNGQTYMWASVGLTGAVQSKRQQWGWLSGEQPVEMLGPGLKGSKRVSDLVCKVQRINQKWCKVWWLSDQTMWNRVQI